jgi:hypothetical protein
LFDDQSILTSEFLSKLASYSNDEANVKHQQQVNKSLVNTSVNKLSLKSTRHSISNTSHHSNSTSKTRSSIK